MQDLKIATIQADLIWQDMDANISAFNHHISKLKECDIIVLPEMFTTGFTMDVTNNSITMNSKYIDWLKRKAIEQDALIMGSLIINENDTFYNRLIIARPNQELLSYDKRHLFRMANEHNHFSGGKNKLILTYKTWYICPLICYDLRFPVWSRNDGTIDLYIYVANWPKARINAWKKLLDARAIENLAYVVGVNRVGIDGNNILYSGGSRVIDFKGNVVYEHKDNEVSSHISKLSKSNLMSFKEKFGAQLDADHFEIKD